MKTRQKVGATMMGLLFVGLFVFVFRSAWQLEPIVASVFLGSIASLLIAAYLMRDNSDGD